MTFPPKERKCHRTGFQMSCGELVKSEACARWEVLVGEHPQTGKPMETWGCSDDQMRTIMLNLGRQLELMQGSLDKIHNGFADQTRERLEAIADLAAVAGELERTPPSRALSRDPVPSDAKLIEGRP